MQENSELYVDDSFFDSKSNISLKPQQNRSLYQPLKEKPPEPKTYKVSRKNSLVSNLSQFNGNNHELKLSIFDFNSNTKEDVQPLSHEKSPIMDSGLDKDEQLQIMKKYGINQPKNRNIEITGQNSENNKSQMDSKFGLSIIDGLSKDNSQKLKNDPSEYEENFGMSVVDNFCNEKTISNQVINNDHVDFESLTPKNKPFETQSDFNQSDQEPLNSYQKKNQESELNLQEEFQLPVEMNRENILVNDEQQVEQKNDTVEPQIVQPFKITKKMSQKNKDFSQKPNLLAKDSKTTETNSTGTNNAPLSLTGTYEDIQYSPTKPSNNKTPFLLPKSGSNNENVFIKENGNVNTDKRSLPENIEINKEIPTPRLGCNFNATKPQFNRQKTTNNVDQSKPQQKDSEEDFSYVPSNPNNKKLIKKFTAKPQYVSKKEQRPQSPEIKNPNKTIKKANDRDHILNCSQNSLYDDLIAGDTLSFLVIGAIGVGKSSFINIAQDLEDNECLPVGRDENGITKKIFPNTTEKLTQIDTPGYDGTKQDPLTYAHQIAKYTKNHSINGIIICINTNDHEFDKTTRFITKSYQKFCVGSVKKAQENPNIKIETNLKQEIIPPPKRQDNRRNKSPFPDKSNPLNPPKPEPQPNQEVCLVPRQLASCHVPWHNFYIVLTRADKIFTTFDKNSYIKRFNEEFGSKVDVKNLILCGKKNCSENLDRLENCNKDDKVTMEIDDKSLSYLCLNVYNIEYSKPDDQTASTELDNKDQQTENQNEDCMELVDNKLQTFGKLQE